MEFNDRAKWLKSLKPGDQVVHENSMGHQTVLKVEKRTGKARVTIHCTNSDGSVHFTFNGRGESGSGYHVNHIDPLMPEVKAKILRRNRVSYLKHFDWDLLSDEDLKTVREIVRATEAKEQT